MKKKKHRRKGWKIILMFLIIVLLLGAILIFGFRTRTVQVEGNEYYGESSITARIQNDDLSVNTLYILFKYNLTDADVPSGVESMSASLVNPWTVKITVKEKEMLGYVDYDGAYLYFDRNGIASLRTKEILEGVPYIEGLEFDASEVEMGSVLPVSDDSIFKKIMDVSNFLTKYSLDPDRLVCEGEGIALYFGSVEVLLGEENYENRLAQVEPILEKLRENYPDTAGTLHLENYDTDSESVRFVPSE